VDDVLVVSGPLMKTAEYTGKGVRILTYGTEATKGTEVGLAAEKTAARVVDKALVGAVEKEGGEKALAELAKDGKTFLKEGEAASKAATTEEKVVAPEIGIGPQRNVLAAERQLSRTGVEAYDKLATQSPAELEAFLDKVRENGWIVKPTDKLPANTPAQFFPQKGRFYYDPERMTVLDMQHEAKHLELFQQRGNWKTGGGQVFRDEIEAYSFEYELGKQKGFSKDYMEYLEKKIEYYKGLASPDGPGGQRPSTMPDAFFKKQ